MEVKKTRIRHPNKLIHGVGIVDIPRTLENIPAYQCWRHMLRRAYATECHLIKTTYAECTVVDEWKTFSNFYEFYKKNFKTGYHLDKDILIKGNKEYGPDACCFVPVALNGIVVNPKGLGAYYDKTKKKYKVNVSIEGKSKHIAHTDTIEEAHIKYLEAKKKYIESIANMYYDRGYISETIRDALVSYMD